MIRQRTEIAEKLREKLFRYVDENEKLGKSYSASAAKIDEDTKEALKALGHI